MYFLKTILFFPSGCQILDGQKDIYFIEILPTVLSKNG